MKKLRYLSAVLIVVLVFSVESLAATLYNIDFGDLYYTWNIIADGNAYDNSTGSFSFNNGINSFSGNQYLNFNNIPITKFQHQSGEIVSFYDVQIDITVWGSAGAPSALLGFAGYNLEIDGVGSYNPNGIYVYDNGNWVDISTGPVSPSYLNSSSLRIKFDYPIYGITENLSSFSIKFTFSGGAPTSGTVSSLNLNINSCYAQVTSLAPPTDYTQDIYEMMNDPPGAEQTIQSFVDSFLAMKTDLENRGSAFFTAANDAMTSINTMLSACGTEIGTYFDAVVYPFSQVELVTEAGGVHLNVLTIIISICFCGYLIGLFRLFLGLMDDDKGKKK